MLLGICAKLKGSWVWKSLARQRGKILIRSVAIWIFWWNFKIQIVQESPIVSWGLRRA